MPCRSKPGFRIMFTLKLEAKSCISCGICRDVCTPGALDMRIWKGGTIEGSTLTYARLHSQNSPDIGPEQTTSFPYLAHPESCDGCSDCARECPVEALSVIRTEELCATARQGLV